MKKDSISLSEIKVKLQEISFNENFEEECLQEEPDEILAVTEPVTLINTNNNNITDSESSESEASDDEYEVISDVPTPANKKNHEKSSLDLREEFLEKMLGFPKTSWEVFLNGYPKERIIHFLTNGKNELSDDFFQDKKLYNDNETRTELYCLACSLSIK